MKIAFLNGYLEPGRDGVGDYTRSLAQECIRQGHHCCLVALNDHYVTEPTMSNTDGLQELRLPATMPWAERIRAAQAMLDAFAPEWISLQFVPYAFHPKGFVWGFGQRLRSLLAERRVQVMFHELWLGETRGTSPKHRLVGAVQKALVRQMLRQIRPHVVQTSNEAYVQVLARQGIHATRLPLFGNIPIGDGNADRWLFEDIAAAGAAVDTANRKEFWLLGFFGTLHPVWPPEPLMGQLRAAAAQAGRHLVLLAMGCMGAAGEALWGQMAARYGPEVTFVRLGQQPAERVSEYLQSLDFGIATSPYSLIGKSGTVAAMLEHGLPVIVNRDDVHFNTPSPDTEDASLYTREAGWKRLLQCPPVPRVLRAACQATAQQFVESLTQASPDTPI